MSFSPATRPASRVASVRARAGVHSGYAPIRCQSRLPVFLMVVEREHAVRCGAKREAELLAIADGLSLVAGYEVLFGDEDWHRNFLME